MTEDDQEADDAERAEEPLSNPGELLYRQVHPTWVLDGVPSSQAFRPTKKDEGMLSVQLGSKTTSEGAYLHYTQELQLASMGTWAVTVGEATEAGRSSFSQALPNSPAHGFVDFRGLGRKETEVAAKILFAKARTRGRLYPPSS